MRSTGLLMALTGTLLLALAVAPASAEACPGSGQGWGQRWSAPAAAAPPAVAPTVQLVQPVPTVIVVNRGSCDDASGLAPAWQGEPAGAYMVPAGGRAWSCHRSRAGRGALGFVLGFATFFVVSGMRRRWRGGLGHRGC